MQVEESGHQTALQLLSLGVHNIKTAPPPNNPLLMELRVMVSQLCQNIMEDMLLYGHEHTCSSFAGCMAELQ
jgi:hypothetical protein